MKVKAIATTATLLIGLGIGLVYTSSSANAATWHRGTPKALRGNWRDSTHKVWFHIRKSEIDMYNSYTPGGKFGQGYNRLKYKYVGHHTYKFKMFDMKYQHYTTDTWRYVTHNRLYHGGMFYRY